MQRLWLEESSIAKIKDTWLTLNNVDERHHEPNVESPSTIYIDARVIRVIMKTSQVEKSGQDLSSGRVESRNTIKIDESVQWELDAEKNYSIHSSQWRTQTRTSWTNCKRIQKWTNLTYSSKEGTIKWRRDQGNRHEPFEHHLSIVRDSQRGEKFISENQAILKNGSKVKPFRPFQFQLRITRYCSNLWKQLAQLKRQMQSEHQSDIPS